MKRPTRIDTVQIQRLDLKLKTPFRTHTKTLQRHSNVHVRIRAGGVWGEGEAYSLEAEAPRASILDAQLAGCDPWDLESNLEKIGDPAGRSAVDLALHDLLGKALGLPVHRFLGLPPTRILGCVSVGVDEPERMIEAARAWIEKGCLLLKIKLTADSDLSLIGAIREMGGSNLRVWVDANQAFTPETVVAAAERLHAFGVEIFEQPLPVGQIAEYAAIRPHIRIPIVLDEEIRSARDVAAAVRAGGVDGVNVKLAKVGGIRESMRAIHVARAHGLEVMIGCYFESSLGISGATHLLALADRIDLDAPLFLEEDPYEGLAYRGGEVGPPERVGLGVRPRAA